MCYIIRCVFSHLFSLPPFSLHLNKSWDTVILNRQGEESQWVCVFNRLICAVALRMPTCLSPFIRVQLDRQCPLPLLAYVFLLASVASLHTAACISPCLDRTQKNFATKFY